MTHRPRHIAGAAAALLALAATFMAAAPSTAAGDVAAPTAAAPVAKTLVIGIDGAAFDAVKAANMPRLEALQAQGTTSVSNLYSAPMAGTWSGPGWSTIATGVWPDKHGVTENDFSSAHFDAYPDYLTRINAARPSRSTVVVGTWESIAGDIFGPGVDQRTTFATDTDTTDAAVGAISHGTADDLFVHLDDVDHAGHAVGTNGAEYGAALVATDARIGRILDAVAARPANEEWTIVAATDHGHTATGGHGGSSPVERRVFMVVAGPGVAANTTRYDAKPVDIAPTLMAAAGVAIRPEWHLDGTPLGSLKADAFDALRPALKPRSDETGIPASTLGWTNAAPAGWSIDNSAMPSGGVAEWSGWAFATDDFWTATDPDQGRETSVRLRDVFAVADSDEWDDKAHASGQFDSTLASPAYPVAGLARASLRYATNYKIDGPQSGTVTVTFDTGQTQTLKEYAGDTNTVESLPFTVPAGATAARFRFRYTGQNSAFWAVDAVGIQDQIAVSNIRYAVNAGGLPSPEWLSLTGATAPAGVLLNTVPEQPYGADPATGAQWGYLGSDSGADGEPGGDMFSTLRYAKNGQDLAYRFGNLAPGKYTVQAGYSDPWPWDNRGARVSINGEIRETDRGYTGGKQAQAYAGVIVGTDHELTFTLSRTRSADVQLSWLIISATDPADTAGPVTAQLAVTTAARCIGGSAYLAMSARNSGTTAIDIDVSSPYGSKHFTAVGPGQSAAVAFNSRTHRIPAGEAGYAAAATESAKAGGATAAPITDAYAAISCG